MENSVHAPVFHPANAKAHLQKFVASSWFLLVSGIIILIAAAAIFLPRLLHPAAPENAPAPTSAAIEEQWGVRITQIAVTADEGMVDLRYMVLDPTKALNFGVDEQSTPTLIPADNPTTVSVTAAMPHKDTLTPGVVYFLLYHNSNGAIKKQTYISLKIGDLELDNFPVR